MKFVTKADFEKAIETVELALKNRQVRYGHHDGDQEILRRLQFRVDDFFTVESNQVSFFVPAMAVKERLLEIRSALNESRKESEKKAKIVEDLEKTEKELVAALAALKE